MALPGRASRAQQCEAKLSQSPSLLDAGSVGVEHTSANVLHRHACVGVRTCHDMGFADVSADAPQSLQACFKGPGSISMSSWLPRLVALAELAAYGSNCTINLGLPARTEDGSGRKNDSNDSRLNW